jgi:hypothetical protein
MRRLAALVVVTLAVPVAAWADGVIINGANETRSVACTKELSEVVVNGSGNTITTTGECTKVVVNSSENKLTLGAVGKLAINGTKNQATVDAVDKIAVTGSANKVVYKKGLTVAKPKIANLGADNTVEQAPAAPAPAP